MGRAISRKKALVVEDEETLRDLAAAMLEETELEVVRGCGHGVSIRAPRSVPPRSVHDAVTPASPRPTGG